MKRYGSLIDNKPSRYDNNLIYIIISLVTFSSIITVTLISNIYLGKSQIEPHGAISSDVKVCSDIGIDQMKNGGSSIDAVVATMFCLGVINSAHSGIGGGGFMLIYSHLKNETHAIDFRETLPQAVIDPFKNQGSLIGIPGEVKGLYLAHRLYGKLPWKSLILPSIDLAKNGYIMTEATVKALHKKFESPEQMAAEYPRLAKIFLKNERSLDESLAPRLRFINVGETSKNPELAHTLQAIADKGVKALYEGQVAKELIDTVNFYNGSMNMEELYAFQPVLRNPFYFNFMDGRYSGITFPTPGAGPRIALVLQVIERLGLPALLREPFNKYSATRYFGRFKKNSNSINEPVYSPVSKKILDIQEADLHSKPVNRFPAYNQKDNINNPKASLNDKNGIHSKYFGGATNRPSGSQSYFGNLPSEYTALYYHWLIEALRFGQAYANFLKDPTLAVLGPNFFNNNSTPVPDSSFDSGGGGGKEKFLQNQNLFGYSTDESIPKPNITAILSAISNQRTFDFNVGSFPGFEASHYNMNNHNSFPPSNVMGTAHVSAIDNNELFVSVTSTLNNLFGSKIMTRHGILLNDEMNDFSSPANNPLSHNIPVPGKRPLSNMAPTIIYETAKPCGLRLVIGGSNGSRIPSGVVQVLVNLLAFGDTLETAMARPRLYPNSDDDVIEFESNFPDDIISLLIQKNHKIRKVNEGLNSVIPVMKIKDTIWATSDPRKSPKQSAAIY